MLREEKLDPKKDEVLQEETYYYDEQQLLYAKDLIIAEFGHGSEKKNAEERIKKYETLRNSLPTKEELKSIRKNDHKKEKKKSTIKTDLVGILGEVRIYMVICVIAIFFVSIPASEIKWLHTINRFVCITLIAASSLYGGFFIFDSDSIKKRIKSVFLRNTMVFIFGLILSISLSILLPVSIMYKVCIAAGCSILYLIIFGR